MADQSQSVGELLERWRAGDRLALDALIPVLEHELRRLARHYLRSERSDHTLQTSALVNEAYVRLVDQPGLGGGNDRHQFIAMAARVMRQILVDYARQHHSAKRGGKLIRVTLDGIDVDHSTFDLTDTLAVHTALEKLEELSSRQSQIVELRVFGGLANQEIADVLDVSLATVNREWRMARAWLFRELSKRTDLLLPKIVARRDDFGSSRSNADFAGSARGGST